jgi:putative SOS response-associated peptidase YedK
MTTLERMIAAWALHLPRLDKEDPCELGSGEIRPTDIAPVVLPGRRLAMLPWGLKVDWQSQPVLNARAETLETKPTFRPLLEQRCLVPATAYFEWKSDGRDKIKTRIHADDHGIIAFAGLIGDGRFTIVTCAPAPSIAHVHDRMPVILDRAQQASWLDRANAFGAVKQVLRPYRGTLAADEIPGARPRQGQLAL